MHKSEEILNKPCLICGRMNRFHKVFVSPYYADAYIAQYINRDWNNKELIVDHYACLNNLKYLEFKAKEKEG